MMSHDPSWKITINGVVTEGSGLLGPKLNKLKDFVDCFSLTGLPEDISIFPKLGLIKIGADNIRVKPFAKLVWFRRMTVPIGSKISKLSWYGAGLEQNGKKCGVKIKPNGSVEQGID